MRDEDAWFAPKRLGCGYRPVRWPGWVATMAFAAALLGLSHAGIRPEWLRWALMAILTAGFLVLAMRTSRAR